MTEKQHQVHVKVEAFTTDEIALRKQDDDMSAPPQGTAEDGDGVSLCEKMKILITIDVTEIQPSQDAAPDATEEATPPPALQELGCTFSLQVTYRMLSASASTLGRDRDVCLVANVLFSIHGHQVLGGSEEASEILSTPEERAAAADPVEEGAEEDEEAAAAKAAKEGE